MLILFLQLLAFAVAGVALAFGWAIGSTLWGMAPAERRPVAAIIVVILLCLVLFFSHTPLPWSR
jgi:hypothetical protein